MLKINQTPSIWRKILSQINISDVVHEVSSALGINLALRNLPGETGYTYALRVDGLKKPIGYEYRIRQSFLSWTIDVYLDNFSGELLRTFELSFKTRKDEVLSVYSSIVEKSQRVIFEINEVSVENLDERPWNTLELQIKYGFNPDEDPMSKFKSLLLCSVGLLMPLFTEDKDQDLEAISADWREEGSLTRVETNRYERSRINRAICLDYYGFTCRGCGLLMNNMYGPLGDGVINVHHIVPVSEMGSSRIIDPIKDLIPLCPNCHTIVHKESPPISPDGLRKITGFQVST